MEALGLGEKRAPSRLNEPGSLAPACLGNGTPDPSSGLIVSRFVGLRFVGLRAEKAKAALARKPKESLPIVFFAAKAMKDWLA